MHKYRFLTSPLGKDECWRDIKSDTPFGAIEMLGQDGCFGVGLPSLQVWTGSNWDWAEELPPHLGGYNRRDERI